MMQARRRKQSILQAPMREQGFKIRESSRLHTLVHLSLNPWPWLPLVTLGSATQVALVHGPLRAMKRSCQAAKILTCDL